MDMPDGAPSRPSPGPLVDLPAPLAEHLKNSPEANATWDSLSADDRQQLAEWIRRAWTRHVQQERAWALYEAMRGGPDALAFWTHSNQVLPQATSALLNPPA